MIYYNDDTASAFVTRPVSGGPLRILASWEPENENEECRCSLYGLSFGKAYLIVAKETYTMTEDGQQACVGQEYSRWSFDLETGEMVELMTDTDGILPYMYGVWEDIAVYQTVKTVEARPSLKNGSCSSRRAQRHTSTACNITNIAFIPKISKQEKKKRS